MDTGRRKLIQLLQNGPKPCIVPAKNEASVCPFSCSRNLILDGYSAKHEPQDIRCLKKIGRSLTMLHSVLKLCTSGASLVPRDKRPLIRKSHDYFQNTVLPAKFPSHFNVRLEGFPVGSVEPTPSLRLPASEPSPPVISDLIPDLTPDISSGIFI